jgi:predicted nucleic-acid-binding Zn-ribbon protein
MTSPKCPRCGSKDFLEQELHHYVDSEVLSEENKNTYVKQLKCIKCDFEFVPSI